ncbi:NAD(P)-binding domain-containing protein [Sphaerisporangium sp. TRM90804]|uniref:NAD(P)-dependent oxidoreductase n=1 Tax=Sphaerisporangium sp. TRM90804 TaxID=3031113 RepID=UPI00244B2B9F|nr:NAD(P)-binding domain-containing protein [Sphaerisporangium sp. TRM90804]MDH2423877.1 NAD(P)-binding domain-containing protein [Sphaerisporangium sp. TRM90804]
MEHSTDKPGLTLLGLGDMGTALARAWLAAGHPLTVWNRTSGKAAPLAAEGARVARTAAEAVAASTLVVVCLLDDASVGEALADADLTGKDVVNLTTGTPAEARARAKWAQARGARFLDGGIMAVPPMIGVPESGGYVFYSGSRALFDAHHGTLATPAGTTYVGEDPGFAALHDVALLSAMTGMFAGVTHAFALVRGEDVPPKDLAPLLTAWLVAMTPYASEIADRLTSGDYTEGVTSNLAMMVQGNATLLRTAREQGVSPELLTPFTTLMERRLAAGHGDEDTTGLIDLLTP